MTSEELKALLNSLSPLLDGVVRPPAIRRVACSSVAGDAAIAHVSTVERAFWGESLCCML